MSTAEERMQSAIEELEQENRLLRARNERLERESEMQRLILLDTLKAAPVQEPMAWLEILRNNKTATDEVIGAFLRGHAEHLTGETFVLTTPPAAQRQWVGLTDEQKLSLEIQGGKSDVMLAELIEGWLKDKNS
jgi:hypothetical protein